MFDISMAKDPAVSLLYLLLACASSALCISHYIFGHYGIMLINMVSVAIFASASIFLYLNRDEFYSKYANIITLSFIAALIQYQLSFTPQLSIHWAYTFPIISYFVLPLSWALILNIVFMLFTLTQVLISFEIIESIRLVIIYLLMGMSSWCYAYFNAVKRKNLLSLAVTDYQSGAYNSRYLAEKLPKEVTRSAVTNRTLSLFTLTIEDFRQIQDIHGDNASNKLLKGFYETVLTYLRAGDEIFHNGKGTFFIILPNCPIEGAMVLKERLLKNLESLQWKDIGDLQLNTGFATLNPLETAEQFLKRASEHVEKQQQTALRVLAFK